MKFKNIFSFINIILNAFVNETLYPNKEVFWFLWSDYKVSNEHIRIDNIRVICMHCEKRRTDMY